MNSTMAIKTFFEKDGGKKVANSELLAFAKEDRKGYNELGKLCAEALGVELDPPKQVTSPEA